jgi:hypothetical protein
MALSQGSALMLLMYADKNSKKNHKGVLWENIRGCFGKKKSKEAL